MILAAAFSLAACLKASASSFEASLGEMPEVELPAVPAPSADRSALLAEYAEYYSALKGYSETAFVSPQGSPAYLEASASGQYLRARLELMASALGGKPSGRELELALDGRKESSFSWAVLNELNDAFGFYGNKAAGAETRGVPIKAGYCQINYVKNNVPFLVQHDGFLNKGEVILTFDDGPGPLTEEVSAAMKNGKAPSLFFVLGSKLGPNGRELVRKSAADGHQIGVHGYNHATESGKPFTALSTQETLRQLGGVKESAAKASGAEPKFFRPPYGVISVEAMKAITSELGLIPVGWTIDTLDWSTKDPDELYAKTVAQIRQRGKGIVLMHDIHPQSRTAAKRLVKWLADNGYTVVSPDRLAKAFRGE
jgi:peptidoglycan/xylan/chitin deacetylase (PgdA/CDA1 family)